MIVGLSTLVGFLIGLVGGGLFGVPVFNYFASDNDWRKLANPTEKVVELLAYNHRDEKVHVETSSRSIYACDTSACVGLAEIPQDKFSRELLYGRDWSFSPAPEPPGIVVAQLQAAYITPGEVDEINHVVLSNGSIWRWLKVSLFPDEIPAYFLILVIGIISTFLGFVGGILLMIFKRVRNRIRA